MSEDLQHPQGPKGPDDPEWVCPFSRLDETSQVIRRRDIMELSDAFKEALSPLRQILEHMKGLNERWEHSNRTLRRVTAFQIALSSISLLSLLVLFIALGYAWQALVLLQSHAAQLSHLERQFEAQTKQLSDLKSTAKNTEAQVAEVREGQEQKPQLELVPETDPVKARRSPVKLRVLAPKVSDKAMPAPSISVSPERPIAEIPLDTEGL